MKSKYRLILILAIAAYIISLLVMGAVSVIESTAEAEEVARLNAIAAPYEKEKVALQREINNAERNFIDKLSCGSALTIAQINLYPEVYSVFYQTFSEFEKDNGDGTTSPLFTGTLCLSPTELPGLDGRITRAEFDELILAGWSTAITVTDADILDLGRYFDTMRDTLEELDIPFPTVAYFTDEVYAPTFDKTLKEKGFTSAILTGEHPEYYIIGQNTNSDIWRVGMMGWSSIKNTNSVHTSSVVALNTLIEERGGLVFGFEVVYGDGSKRDTATQYYPYGVTEKGEPYINGLKRMLAQMETYIKTEKLMITTVDEGRALYTEHLRQREYHADELSQYVERLEGELADVKALLKKIYAGEYTGDEVE